MAQGGTVENLQRISVFVRVKRQLSAFKKRVESCTHEMCKFSHLLSHIFSAQEDTHYLLRLIRDKNMGPQVLRGWGTTKMPSLW